VHGDQTSIEWMKDSIEKRLPEAEVHIPKPHQEIAL
jgi:hypothetical protein